MNKYKELCKRLANLENYEELLAIMVEIKRTLKEDSQHSPDCALNKFSGNLERPNQCTCGKDETKLNSCDKSHKEIYFYGKECPVCKLLDKIVQFEHQEY